MNNIIKKITFMSVSGLAQALNNELVHRSALVGIIAIATVIWYYERLLISQNDHLAGLLFILGVILLAMSYSTNKVVKDSSRLLVAILILSLLYSAIIISIFYFFINIYNR